MPRLSYRRRLMLRKLLRVLGIVLAAAIVIGAALLLYLEPYVTYDRDGAHLMFTKIGKLTAVLCALAVSDQHVLVCPHTKDIPDMVHICSSDYDFLFPDLTGFRKKTMHPTAPYGPLR